MMQLPAEPDPQWERIARMQLVYSIAGLVLGLASIVGGIVLFFRGISGSSSWIAEAFGFKSTLSDAAPGTVLFVVGIFVVVVTRFDIRIVGKLGPGRRRK